MQFPAPGVRAGPLPGSRAELSNESHDTRWRPPDAPCLNCGNTTAGRFCPACGQRKTWVRVSVRTMVAEVLEDQLVLNRALPRTVGALLFRPGFLTQEYVRGRIVSYIAPFRLYLVASVLFFLILSFVGLSALDVDIDSVLSTNADSARAELQERIDELSGIDTTSMPEAARAGIRGSLAANRAALDAIPDSATVLDPVRLDSISDLALADTVSVGGRQPWARSFRASSRSNFIENAMQRKVAQVEHLPPREAIRAVLRDLLEYAPHMVFLLLPVFALLLKLLYVRRNRFYAEHFVFALHVHAFVFVMMTLMILVPWSRFDLAAGLSLMVYVWVAMKRVYAQGWIRTTLKWWTLGWLYAFVLLFGLIGLGLVTLVLT
jgi:hypothetical protein